MFVYLRMFTTHHLCKLAWIANAIRHVQGLALDNLKIEIIFRKGFETCSNLGLFY